MHFLSGSGLGRAGRGAVIQAYRGACIASKLAPTESSRRCVNLRNKNGAFARPIGSSWRLLADLFFLDFSQGFAVYAHVRSRACLKSANTDFDAARLAPAILFVFDELQGLVDFFD